MIVALNRNLIRSKIRIKYKIYVILFSCLYHLFQVNHLPFCGTIPNPPFGESEGMNASFEFFLPNRFGWLSWGRFELIVCSERTENINY
jgi:hypothetical protein